MKNQFMFLCTITFMHSLFPLQITENQAALNVKLLGIRDDTIDLGYIQDLLAQGAQITARDAARNTPLMKFAKRSHYPECRLLILHSQFYGTIEEPTASCYDVTQMSYAVLRNRIQKGLEKENETIEKLVAHKIKRLKPLLQEALNVTRPHDRELKELLDPEKLEQNLQKEIRECMRQELKPKSGLFSWNGIG